MHNNTSVPQTTPYGIGGFHSTLQYKSQKKCITDQDCLQMNGDKMLRLEDPEEKQQLIVFSYIIASGMTLWFRVSTFITAKKGPTTEVGIQGLLPQEPFDPLSPQCDHVKVSPRKFGTGGEYNRKKNV